MNPVLSVREFASARRGSSELQRVARISRQPASALPDFYYDDNCSPPEASTKATFKSEKRIVHPRHDEDAILELTRQADELWAVAQEALGEEADDFVVKDPTPDKTDLINRPEDCNKASPVRLGRRNTSALPEFILPHEELATLAQEALGNDDLFLQHYFLADICKGLFQEEETPSSLGMESRASTTSSSSGDEIKRRFFADDTDELWALAQEALGEEGDDVVVKEPTPDKTDMINPPDDCNKVVPFRLGRRGTSALPELILPREELASLAQEALGNDDDLFLPRYFLEEICKVLLQEEESAKPSSRGMESRASTTSSSSSGDEVKRRLFADDADELLALAQEALREEGEGFVVEDPTPDKTDMINPPEDCNNASPFRLGRRETSALPELILPHEELASLAQEALGNDDLYLQHSFLEKICMGLLEEEESETPDTPSSLGMESRASTVSSSSFSFGHDSKRRFFAGDDDNVASKFKKLVFVSDKTTDKAESLNNSIKPALQALSKRLPLFEMVASSSRTFADSRSARSFPLPTTLTRFKEPKPKALSELILPEHSSVLTGYEADEESASGEEFSLQNVSGHLSDSSLRRAINDSHLEEFSPFSLLSEGEIVQAQMIHTIREHAETEKMSSAPKVPDEIVIVGSAGQIEADCNSSASGLSQSVNIQIRAIPTWGCCSTLSSCSVTEDCDGSEQQTKYHDYSLTWGDYWPGCQEELNSEDAEDDADDASFPSLPEEDPEHL